jgi:hypothetical protein
MTFWHPIYTHSKKNCMNWLSFSFRGVLTVCLVCGILYWAEMSFPMAALLVFLLATSVMLTWVIINLLKDEDVLTGMFDD